MATKATKILIVILVLLVPVVGVGAYYIGTNVEQTVNKNKLPIVLEEAYMAGCRSAVLPADYQYFDAATYKTQTDNCISNSKNFSHNYKQQ